MSAIGAASWGEDIDAVASVATSPRLAAPRRLLRLRSDAALGERFCWGDDDSFAVLYERHRASVMAVCIGVLGARHDAEDAAQEAFAALAVALRQSPPREIGPWLSRVSRNAAIDVARRRRANACVDEALADRADHGTGANAELESVMAGIRQLPQSQRTALLMRELAGHSYAEIATLLEIEEDAVRGLIARARVGLRAHRDANELPCARAREALADEPDGRRHTKTVRRHLRACRDCRDYRQALRDDARVLRGLLPASAGGLASGGAIVGGLAAKGTLVGGALTQLTAACAVSVCAVGGVVLLSPNVGTHAGASHARKAHLTRLLVGAPESPSATSALVGASTATGAVVPGRGAVAPTPRSSGGTSAAGAAPARSGAPVSIPTVAVKGRFHVPRGRGSSSSGGGSGTGSGSTSTGGGSAPGAVHASPGAAASGPSQPPPTATTSSAGGGSGSASNPWSAWLSYAMTLAQQAASQWTGGTQPYSSAGSPTGIHWPYSGSTTRSPYSGTTP